MPGPALEEARDWMVILQAFTVRDLARSMAVSDGAARRFVLAMMEHGSVEPVGSVNGSGPPRELYGIAPFPPGPRVHPRKTPPEVSVRLLMGGDPLNVRRGVPVRLVDHGERRDRAQVAGSGQRRRMLQRDRAYERMEAAVAARRAKQKEREARPLSDIEARARRRRERRQARLLAGT